jgi:hypothetical protein
MRLRISESWFSLQRFRAACPGISSKS